ncbi:MAG: class I SAM-dependent methyltransferase [Halobacteriota archaeon]
MHSPESADESETSTKVVKGHKKRGIERLTAKWYNRSNARKRMEEYKRWAQLVAENAAEGDSILEVAPGPGYLAIELAKRGRYRIVGLDLSSTFVEIAQKNAAEAGVGAAVEFRQGDAAHMPFDDERFDFIISTAAFVPSGDKKFNFIISRAAFKHFADPVGVLREMYRVLRTDGKAVIIDVRSDASDETIRDIVKSMGLSRIDSIVRDRVLKSFRRTAYTKNQIEDYISKTNFRRHDIRDSEHSIECEIWLEK